MRARAFCVYCGRVIGPRSTTCIACADLPALDPTRRLPVRLLAVYAAEHREALEAAREIGD